VRAIGGVDGLESVDEVLLGVDTHLDVNVAVALDQLGRRLGELKVPTTTRGYERLLRWAEGFGPVGCAGIEGTSSYGAGLARHLRAAGISVMELGRPKRRLRASGATANPTPSTRRQQLGRCWPVRRSESPRAQTARWR
jgi:transposase